MKQRSGLPTVIIVEDTSKWQRILSRECIKAGLRPVAVGSLAAAAELLERQHFGVALVDIRLSEHDDKNPDGLNVLALLRDKYPWTAAVVVTGKGDAKLARDVLKDYKAFDFLEKVPDGDVYSFDSTIGSALEHHKTVVSMHVRSATFYLHGSQEVSIFEHGLLLFTGVGVENLQAILARATEGLLPFRLGGPSLSLTGEQLYSGKFWSFALGATVQIGLAKSEAALDEFASADDSIVNGSHLEIYYRATRCPDPPSPASI
jgi:ActR/RegA family two-component response regulator